MTKTCSHCTATFTCQNEMPGCWCENIILDTPTLQHLEENYDDCLCPQCLPSFQQAAMPGSIPVE